MCIRDSVWGDWQVSSSADVLRNWELLKDREKSARGESATTASTLDGIPPALPALARSQKIPVSYTHLDVYKRQSYDVEKTRVGQVADYDRVVMEIWTDGTLKPEDALAQAAQLLMQHLRPIAGVSEDSFSTIEEERHEEMIPNEIYDTPIEQLDLSVRVFNSLKRTGITKVGEMLEMLDRGEETMLAIRNFGEKSLDELKQQLRLKGFLAEEDEVKRSA